MSFDDEALAKNVIRVDNEHPLLGSFTGEWAIQVTDREVSVYGDSVSVSETLSPVDVRQISSGLTSTAAIGTECEAAAA